MADKNKANKRKAIIEIAEVLDEPYYSEVVEILQRNKCL